LIARGLAANAEDNNKNVDKMVKADQAKDTRSSFDKELKRMVMEEYSRKRQAKKDDEEDGFRQCCARLD
jgi:hypothetical protein